MIAATIPDELAARVPGYSPDRGDFRRRGTNRVFEEGRSSAVDGRCSMVEGWPTIWPSLGPQRCKSDEPERSRRTPRREKESRETGPCFRFDVRLARFRSVASVAHGVFASQDSGIGHHLRNSSRLLWTPRKSGPASSLSSTSAHFVVPSNQESLEKWGILEFLKPHWPPSPEFQAGF